MQHRTMKAGNYCVMFAPVLKSEGWLSINLQQADILRALETTRPDLPVTVLQPAEGLSRLPLGKRFSREVLYPWLVVRTGRALSRRGFRPLLHVADHSYGHLCRWWQPSVVNCNDVTHFVRPEISGPSLWLWRRRVRAMRHARKILTISDHLAGEVRQHLPTDSGQVLGMPGGIDTSVFKPAARQEARPRVPGAGAFRPEDKLVVNIGSNVARKNLPTVLRAIAILRAQGRPVKLLKAGKSLHDSEHAPLLRELGIADAVIDLGMLAPPQVAALCQAAHALSFASLYEGFGRPTLEAQACGLPCVLADSSCMREVGGDAALYHAPLDPHGLAAHLETALFDEDARARLIRRGFANVRRFSWSGYAARLREIYDEVMLGPEPRLSQGGSFLRHRESSPASGF
jgi:glycosyltransferase involved in cell wall biosynthesis